MRSFIQKYALLTENEWHLINDAFNPVEFRKNEMILSEGQVCRHFYFLEKGLIRFFILKDGNDITKYFTVAPYFFTSPESFRKKEPANENIQALEDCVAYRINLQQADELLKLKTWALFTREFVREVQQHTGELLLETKTETAEKRYEKLLTRYPDVIHRIPLKHLSSFLGIAPQSLSRIRQKFRNSPRT
jgi:CRP-like cAMP-binding protein